MKELKKIEEMTVEELSLEITGKGLNLPPNADLTKLQSIVTGLRDSENDDDNSAPPVADVVSAPTIIGKPLKNNKDLQKSLEDQGMMFVSSEEMAQIQETIRVQQQTLQTVTAKLESINETRIADLQGLINGKGSRISIADNSTAETYKAIAAQPTATVYVPRTRNIDGASILKKELKMNSDGSIAQIGNKAIFVDKIEVIINGAMFKYELGQDNDDGILVEMPWDVAKILARSFNQSIRCNATGETYTPPNLQKPVQHKVQDGQIITTPIR